MATTVDPNDLADLTQIKGDEDANKFSEIDPLGGAIFGWGNTAYNNEIARKNAKLAALKANLQNQRLQGVEGAVGANAGDWSQLGQELFGSNGQKLDDTYAGIEGADQGSLKDLLASLGNYKNSADFFNDKNFMGDVGDVTNQALPSQATLSNQQDALKQFKQLSTPQETAQEKLVRMMAERDAESKMAGDREALARGLKARGVYGSGAELTSNLESQGQAADRWALSNAQANAQASQRAMQALGSYASMTNQMRSQEASEGNLANQVAEFNNQANQQTSNQRAAQQVAATQAGQTALQNRAAQGFQASQNVNNAQRGDVKDINATKTGYTTGETGNRTQGAAMQSDALGGAITDIGNAQAANEAKKKTSLLGLG